MSATLKANLRKELGSRSARRLRDAGRIPATIQGGDKDHVDLCIDSQEFWTARRAHEHLFDIEVGGKAETAVVRELQWDSFGDAILHVEFKRVKRGEKLETEVELEFVGHPKGGIVNHLVTHVTIRAIPSMIPDVIEIRVEELEPGDSIEAGQLLLPEGSELAMDPETRIAVINVPRAEVEPTEEEAAPAEGEVPTAEEEAASEKETPSEGSED